MDDFAMEAKQVVRLAAQDKQSRAAAAVIRGAINNVYERAAEDMLRRVDAQATALGMTRAQVHKEVASMLLLQAAEAALRSARKAPMKNPRPRIKNHSHGDIKHLLALVGRDVKQAHAIYRKGDAKQAASMLQMLMFRAGALNTVALDSLVPAGGNDWMKVQGAQSAVDKAMEQMRETAGVAFGDHRKKAGKGVRGFGLSSGKIKRVANPRVNWAKSSHYHGTRSIDQHLMAIRAERKLEGRPPLTGAQIGALRRTMENDAQEAVAPERLKSWPVEQARAAAWKSEHRARSNPATAAYRWFTPELEARASAIPQLRGTRYSPFSLKAEDTRFRAGYFDGSKGQAPAPNRTEAYALGYVAGRLDVGRAPLGLLKTNPKGARGLGKKRIRNLPSSGAATSARFNPRITITQITRGKPFDYGSKKNLRSYIAHFSDGTTSEVGPGVVGNLATDEEVRYYFKGILADKNIERGEAAHEDWRALHLRSFPASATAEERAQEPKGYMRRNPGVGSFLDSNLDVNTYLKRVKAQQKRDLAKVKLAYVHRTQGGVDIWEAPFRGGKVVVYHGPNHGIAGYSVYWNHSHYSNAKTLAAAKQTGREAAGYFNGLASNAMGATKGTP